VPVPGGGGGALSPVSGMLLRMPFSRSRSSAVQQATLVGPTCGAVVGVGVGVTSGAVLAALCDAIACLVGGAGGWAEGRW